VLLAFAHVLALTLIGPPRVRWRGQEVAFPTRKSLALLAYLALSRVPVDRDELAELLWTHARKRNLRTELHRLRRLPGAATWLLEGDHLRLASECDATRFEQAVESERFAEALALWPRGEQLLRGLAPTAAPAFAEWLDLERERYTGLLAGALRGLALELAGEGDDAAALELSRRLIELDPLDETAYRTAMRLEYRRGHVEGALALFEACRRALAGELGVEPLPETQELARAVERGVLAPPPGVVRLTPRIPSTLLRPPVLAGREREWARLEDAYRRGQTVNVSGPAGVGKTRLVLDFVRAQGSVFLLEGRPGDATLPYACFSRALGQALADHPGLLAGTPDWVRRELARLVPGLEEGDVEAPSGGPDRLRLFEALVRTMDALRRRVGAIVVDDLHALDDVSFEEGLRAQARLMTESPRRGYARIYATYRSGEIPAAFERGIALAAAVGIAVRLELGPLDEAGVRELVAGTGLGEAAELAPRLHRLTGGNPAFVVETLKAALETGSLDADGLDGIAVPERVEGIIRRRIERLEPPLLRLLQTVAALRTTPDPELLAGVLGADALEVAGGLSTLEQAQVLGHGGFVHDLLHETVVAATPPAVAALLHRRIASALESNATATAPPGHPDAAIGGSERGTLATRIAHHWTQAGEDQRARSWWLDAAEAYRAAGLQQAALDVLQRGLARVPTDPGLQTSLTALRRP
jgi:DNA-binding SARP family transcriptional activator